MQELATYAEIKKQYDGEWVLIINPVMTKTLEIVEGIVACHSKDRDEVYQEKPLGIETQRVRRSCSLAGLPETWSMRCEISVRSNGKRDHYPCAHYRSRWRCHD